MEIFEPVKEIEKYVFCPVTNVGQRKNSESPQGIKPQMFGYHTSMFYH